MPQTAAEVAKQVRDQYPGAYDDLSDEELAARMAAKRSSPAAARVVNIVTAKGGKPEDAWNFFNPLESSAKAVMHSDYPGAILKGLAHVVGIPTEIPKTPAEALRAVTPFVPNIYGDIQQGVDMLKGGIDAYRRTKAAPTTVRKVQAATSGVPMVGAPIAAVAEPGIEYAEGTEPTHEANVAAVEAGTTLAAMGAGVLLRKAAGRSAAAKARVENVMRARGVAPEAAPEPSPADATADASHTEAAAEPETSAADAHDALLNANRRLATRVYDKHIDRLDEADVEPGERYRVDELFDKNSKPEDVAAGREIYDSFAKTRELLKEKHGDTIRLVRAEAPENLQRPDKTVLHWYEPDDPNAIAHASIEDGARQLRDEQIPIDDIVAVPYRGKGKTGQEYLVLNRASEALADPVKSTTAQAEPPTRAAEPTPSPQPIPSPTSPDFGKGLVARYTGESDVRTAEANQLHNYIEKALPDPVDRAAVSLMRDEKGQPGHLQAILDGTHPVFEDAIKKADAALDTGGKDLEPASERADRAKGEVQSRVDELKPVIERALNPTPEMKQVDSALTSYFQKTYNEASNPFIGDSKVPAEGRTPFMLDGKPVNLNVMESSIAPENYVNHLLQPVPEADAELAEPGRLAGGGMMSDRTPFAIKRGYPTILEAKVSGSEPRTLDVADAVSIYGKRHGQAMAAAITRETLKASGVGKWVTGGRENAPVGWVNIGDNAMMFHHDVPYHDLSGKTEDGSNHIAIGRQSMYVPPAVAKALKPLIEPNVTAAWDVWQKMQRWQDYIKSANVALSFFHAKAMGITAFNSMRTGPFDMAKALMMPLDSPEFQAAERAAIQTGGVKTSIVGQTAEAYLALLPKALPTKVEVIRNLPVMRQLDQVAAATSKLTFDVLQRKWKVWDFATKDAAWIAEHPNATPAELAVARQQNGRAINAFYGGLNWENLGISRTAHAIMRFFMFAPDWTYSNIETAKLAFQGGAGGAAARWYVARSVAASMAATAVMTYAITGKRPDQVPGPPSQKLFSVYLGDDEKGNHKFVSLFNAGMQSDAITAAGNIADYGLIKGGSMTIANKAAAFSRAAIHAETNKNFMGQDIVPQGAGPVAGTARSLEAIAGDVAPNPFSFANAWQMATDQKRDYSPGEYAAAVLAGIRPRRVYPDTGMVPITSTKWVPEPPRNSTWDIIKGAPVYKKHGG